MKRLLISLSLLLNVIVVGGVIALFLFPMPVVGAFLGDFIALSHERWVSQFEALPVQEGDVVFLGDSITEGGAWDELLPYVSVRNRGIGGDTTVGVLERLHQVASGQPDKVFLLIGTNDLFIGVPEEEIAANVGRIIDSIRSSSPPTEVYLQSVLPREAEYRQRVESLNQRLLAVAGERGAGWVDLYPHFLDESDGSISNELANDELHLMGKGYLLWREQIEGLL